MPDPEQVIENATKDAMTVRAAAAELTGAPDGWGVSATFLDRPIRDPLTGEVYEALYGVTFRLTMPDGSQHLVSSQWIGRSRK